MADIPNPGGEQPILLNRSVTEMLTYTNPVYSGYFADPFVWKVKGEYYAVGTGPLEGAGQIKRAEEISAAFATEFRIFPLLRSRDLVNWQFVGGALNPPDPALGQSFWAPEVVVGDDGVFYMYYSVGVEDRNHQLRVATSDHPMGPYNDVGKALINPGAEPFAIDAHPFRDDDGQWYLFYARDFLSAEGEHRAGTALMVDRMVNMTTLTGEAKVVLRARSDWQLFQAKRAMPQYGEGAWDWHTLEGPTVRKHEGRYYCFYSGGRWESDNYGVDYGVADTPMGPYSDAGNESGARVLRTSAGHLLGPGHNSIVTGPDHATEYVVYHAWDPGWTARRMCIDPLVWTPDGPRCSGPTYTEQKITVVRSGQELL